MKSTKIFTAFIILLSLTFAQDSLKYKWIPDWFGSVNISQVSFKNWSKGGENSLAWTLKSDFKLTYKTDTWNFITTFNGEFGKTQLGDAELRTTANDIFLENLLSLNVGWGVDPYVSNIIRTQITTGYNYKVTPAQKIADFWDPGYITQSIGFTYDKIKNFKTRLGLAFKETVTDNFHQYSDKIHTPEIENFKFETGFESVTSGKLDLAENVTYTGELRLFTRFEHLNIWDVRWDNVINAKVNSWLNVNFSFLLIYEKAQSLKTQRRQALQVGIKYKIL